MMTLRPRFAVACTVVCLFGMHASASAEVVMPGLFSNHMVLQQEATLPIWGWAAPGETITATLRPDNGDAASGTIVTGSATAHPDGAWRIDLPPQVPGSAAKTLIIAGSSTITIHDVVIGEVWLCAGQSNMEMRIGNRSPDRGRDHEIRLFHVPHVLAVSPHIQVAAGWEVCSPESVENFSAVAMAFGEALRPSLKRPLGLIESAWGGTGAQEWTSLPALQGEPLLKNYAGGAQAAAAKYPSGDDAYQAAQKTTDKTVKIPGRGTPTLIFNGMIAPLIPYALKGIIWYQGENNARNTALAEEYATLFPTMIGDWRKRWQQTQLPFLFVQLPNLASQTNDWPRLREAQFKTLDLPQTGMAVTIDIGVRDNIHPPDKLDVGKRLALAARHLVYGESVVGSGPLYAGMQVKGETIEISFRPTTLGGGLAIGKRPWNDPKGTPPSTDVVQGFQIAGDDRVWVAAQVTISGAQIVVSSSQVKKPVAVRYAWANDPLCNLANVENLPASPFRTDNWVDAPSKPTP